MSNANPRIATLQALPAIPKNLHMVLLVPRPPSAGAALPVVLNGALDSERDGMQRLGEVAMIWMRAATSQSHALLYATMFSLELGSWQLSILALNDTPHRCLGL